LLAGIVLTALGLIGLAATVGDPEASRALVRFLFVPMYVVGALALIGGGVWWLTRYLRTGEIGKGEDGGREIR
jgi:hypothetical protein